MPKHLTVGLACLLTGCATIPKAQYGVRDLEWEGVEQMDSEALEACLATRERDAVTVRLGLGAPNCGEPPFDRSAPAFDTWAWPWTPWPVYDPAILGVDRERIERWYAARGFYDAKVTRVTATAGGEAVRTPECRGEQSCKVALKIEVEEGVPVEVIAVRVELQSPLAPELERGLNQRPTLRPGMRFDEASYAADKVRLTDYLRDASYARAQVTGHVVVDRARHTVQVAYRVTPGPPCVFGEVTMKKTGDVPTDLVVRTAAITRGAAYSNAQLVDAQRAIFRLGVFSSAKLREHYPAPGNVVDVEVEATPGRLIVPSVGVGVMSGTLRRTTSDEIASVPMWDVHLRAAFEHRNLFGGLRRLRIEDRPRLILLDNFPMVPAHGPKPGNTLSLQVSLPGAFEARTEFFSDHEWDWGPDPFYGFFRHDLALKNGFRRPFAKQRILVQVALQTDFYNVIEDSAPDEVSNYRLPFLEQQVRFDWRDDALRPSRGLYASVTVHEALWLGGYGSWTYVRVVPDVRGYIPLFWDVVFAARFSLGALMIVQSSRDLDPTSAALGPQSYRFRGGGADSNRGFFAGQLGDGIDGGTRRIEGSAELRIPLGSKFALVGFWDIGDVSRAPHFRFGHLNTATGAGLRYYTFFGPIRLDVAWLVPGLQRVGPDPPDVDFGPVPAAVHFTIGEAF